jgi:hypothetical protein
MQRLLHAATHAHTAQNNTQQAAAVLPEIYTTLLDINAMNRGCNWRRIEQEQAPLT